MAVNFRDSEGTPTSNDFGNKDIQGRVVSKTVQLAMFTTNRNAVWAGNNILMKVSYPFGTLKIPVNRNLFRLQAGDCFRFTFPKYSISEMIFRVVSIEEDNLESENIIIIATEDSFSISSPIVNLENPVDYKILAPDYSLEPLVNQKIIEAPYDVKGDEIAVIPLAARVLGMEVGFHVYMSSSDPPSYEFIKSVAAFCVYGTLVNEYTDDTFQIDDEIGMTVDFIGSDIANFESITRQDLLGIKNLVVVDDEIMTVQNITPISGGDGNRYTLTGVYRGRFDSEKATHLADAGLYMMDGSKMPIITNDGLVQGATRDFKLVPYNIKNSGDISLADPINVEIASRSRKPYNPKNLKANDASIDPTYTADIVLSWSPRVRGEGAGYYTPDTTDAYPTWEGYFEIEVWVSSVKVRTKTEIDDLSWTYTEAMNIADNGSLANEVVFKLKNYIPYEIWDAGESDQIEITVTKE
jgi:hypothetical protein